MKTYSNCYRGRLKRGGVKTKGLAHRSPQSKGQVQALVATAPNTNGRPARLWETASDVLEHPDGWRTVKPCDRLPSGVFHLLGLGILHRLP